MSKAVEEQLRKAVGFGLPSRPVPQSTLHAKFGMPPYSIWNTREGWWQEKKSLWLKFGIKSELGRKDGLTFNIPLYLADGTKAKLIEAETSIFDPVLCEMIYRFWCPPGGVIVDPFAGGSVRGIVASVLGMRYWGCDLRAEQIDENNAQAAEGKHGKYKPRWVCGDSRVQMAAAPACDFFFSCPPYGDLEVYSDDPADLSNMGREAFLAGYREIIAAGVAKLKPDRFACFVVGNYRDKKTGHMTDLVGQTVRAFEDAGAAYYNDVVLVNAVGTGGMRTNGSYVRGGRKIVKMHQNVLVFLKGDNKAAGAAATKPDDNFVDRSAGA